MLIADFQTCFYMGAATPGGGSDSSLENRCQPGAGEENIIAAVDYYTPDDWASFWIGLQEADFASYDTLTFFARGDVQMGIPPIVMLELKREDNARVGIYNLAGISGQWRRFAIPLAAFRVPPDSLPLCGWEGMSELVFTFKSEESGQEGRVYLDNIYVERHDEGAPTPGPDCLPTAETTQESTDDATTSAASSPEPGTLTPSTEQETLVVADFDTCKSPNNLGGEMGAAYDSPNKLEESFIEVGSGGCFMRLKYHSETWSAFWTELLGVDLGAQSRLAFDVRAEAPLPQRFKIELKRPCPDGGCSEMSVYYVDGITTEWQTKSVALQDFGSVEWAPPLSSYDGLQELVFTFESAQTGTTDGVVYLDNIVFEP